MLSKNAPKFIVEKQARQLKNFSPERIKQLYRLVLETDFAIKSGLMQKEQAEFNIVQAFLS